MTVKRKLFNTIHFILYSAIAVFLISCVSSKEEEYGLITDREKSVIKDFCKCSEPVQPLLKRLTNGLKDSANSVNFMNDSNYMKNITDSLDSMLKNLVPCFSKAEYIFDKKDMSERKEKQMLKYFEQYYPDCLPLVMGEKIKDTIKLK